MEAFITTEDLEALRDLLDLARKAGAVDLHDVPGTTEDQVLAMAFFREGWPSPVVAHTRLSPGQRMPLRHMASTMHCSVNKTLKEHGLSLDK